MMNMLHRAVIVGDVVKHTRDTVIGIFICELQFLQNDLFSGVVLIKIKIAVVHVHKRFPIHRTFGDLPCTDDALTVGTGGEEQKNKTEKEDKD